MGFHFRPKYQTLGTNFVVSAVPVKVAAITIANSAGSAATITAVDASGTTVGTWVVPAGTTIVMNLADGQDGGCNFFNGLTFNSDAATTRVFVVCSR